MNIKKIIPVSLLLENSVCSYHIDHQTFLPRIELVSKPRFLLDSPFSGSEGPWFLYFLALYETVN